MNFPQIAGIGVFIAAITAGWSYVRMIVGWVASLVVVRVLVSGEASRAMLSYCWKRSVPSPLGSRTYGGFDNYVHPPRRILTVGFENISDSPALFWFGRCPVILRRIDRNCKENSGEDTNTDSSVLVYFLRGSFKADELIGGAVDYYNEQRAKRTNGHARSRFFIRRVGGSSFKSNNGETPATPRPPSATISNGGRMQESIMNGSIRMLKWDVSDLVAVENGTPFGSYPFPARVEEAVNELRRWKESEEWFRKKGVPWRRGWLLHGRPGTGKSTIVRAIAMELDLPLFVFDLATLDNESFHAGWRDLMSYAPCCALFEDIDSVFSGRENIAVKTKQQMGLTFDCLLNTVSGVERADGVLLFVTTNHIDQVDPALGIPQSGKSTRPGRIDRAVELDVMEEPERRRLAHLILGDFPDQIDPTIEAGDGETASQFSDRCTQLALRLFWSKK